MDTPCPTPGRIAPPPIPARRTVRGTSTYGRRWRALAMMLALPSGAWLLAADCEAPAERSGACARASAPQHRQVTAIIGVRG